MNSLEGYVSLGHQKMGSLKRNKPQKAQTKQNPALSWLKEWGPGRLFMLPLMVCKLKTAEYQCALCVCSLCVSVSLSVCICVYLLLSLHLSVSVSVSLCISFCVYMCVWEKDGSFTHKLETLLPRITSSPACLLPSDRNFRAARVFHIRASPWKLGDILLEAGGE